LVLKQLLRCHVLKSKGRLSELDAFAREIHSDGESKKMLKKVVRLQELSEE
jgi:hypothetical protein